MDNKIIIQVNPFIDYSVRGLCVKPYYNHKKGCPNFNKKDGCPPQALFYDKAYDLTKPIYAICNKFDLQSHVEKMKINNPNWSDRQLKCVLYWQPKARKQLESHINDFLNEYGNQYNIEKCPEAMGVNLIKTMASVGIELKFPVEDTTYQIALAGIKK